MKIVVTGGAGFIGSHLCDGFLEHGHEVLCLDNLSTGYAQNIAHLKDHPMFSFVEGSVADFEVCMAACKGADAVCHQAALGSVPRSIEHPLATHDANATGFINMLTAAKNNGIVRFVYASSSSVYGDNVDLPKTEEKVGLPLSPYAVSKKTNELYAAVFASLYGMQTIGLRYFNVFGPRQSPNGAYAAVIPKFVSLLKAHQAPVINGDGSQMRDFTNVANVVQANLLALESKQELGFNDVYNVACGERTTLVELFDLIKRILAQKDAQIAGISPVFGSQRAGDIQKSYASIDKIKGALGYAPLVYLQEGLERMLK